MLNELKVAGEAPEWMTEAGFKTLSQGYLLPNETPRGMYRRVANAAAKYGYVNADKVFDAFWRNWLCPATPVAANMGTTRGLPISCYSIHPEDSLDSILTKNHELGMLAKFGGGVGIYGGALRGRGAPVHGTGGKSDGVAAWAKIYDSTIHSVAQGQTRRGAAALYLDVDHPDIEEFLLLRKPTGDANTRCFNLNTGVVVTDAFMQSLEDGHEKNRKLWEKILTERFETGEPYIMFGDTVNNNLPPAYVNNGFKVRTSNLCSEILLYTDPEHTFVCCLSSLNLARWDEWKDTDVVQTSIAFLDSVLEEFIEKTDILGQEALTPARNFAIRSRALGLGVLGWHSLLQSKSIAFDSFDAMMLNSKVFSTIKKRAEAESQRLAHILGEPKWCKGTGYRNTHLMAIAPTVSNSTISGDVSAGIEPLAANVFVQNSAKGSFIRKNPYLATLLEQKGQNTPEVWSEIAKNQGSVADLPFLNEKEKEVFLTAREINQFAIVRQAGARQKYIDQGQSVNLFFAANSSPRYVHQVHMEAWKVGLKTLYYCRNSSPLRGDFASRSAAECKACEG